MEIKELTEKISGICDIYVKKYEIDQNQDWLLLKIQEELGELSSAYLKLTKRGRVGVKTRVELENNLQEEIADVLAFILLFSRAHGIDPEQAIKNKWFKYLENEKS
jgi:NTP pyrophosphatase (non-canonical NTP hydrolase)